jgi:hypothetical protein
MMTNLNISATVPQNSVEIRKPWLQEMFDHILRAEQNYRQNVRLRGMEDHRLEDMGLLRALDGRIVRR